MHEFRDETGLWATAGSASSAKDLLARGARADDAIRGAAPRKIEPGFAAKRARGRLIALTSPSSPSHWAKSYGWSKEFLEAGKRRLAGDTARAATSGLRPM